MSQEMVPTFFVLGEHIVDVTYTTWEENGPGRWDLVGVTEKLEVSEHFDRVVFETPIGCFEAKIELRKGDNITFFPKANESSTFFPLIPCQRTRGFKEVEDKQLEKT